MIDRGTSHGRAQLNRGKDQLAGEKILNIEKSQAVSEVTKEGKMFIIDCETHLWPPMDDMNYYPNFKRFIDGLIGYQRSRFLQFSRGPIELEGDDHWAKYRASIDAIRARAHTSPQADAESLISSMDGGGVQLACVIPEGMIDLTNGHRVRSTNGWVAREIAKYPDRLIGVANLGPILKRGIKAAIYELELLVKEKSFKAVKFYPPDEGPPNCRDYWPFYNKVRELGIALFIHTGLSLTAIGLSAPCHPLLLEEVCIDFPEIPIVAFHMGFPYNTELNWTAAKFPNLHICTSLLPRFSFGYTKKAQELLGEALVMVGNDKLIWGSDWSGSLVGHKEAVEFLETIQISKELQKDYHFPALSQKTREEWAGLNLARILGINPSFYQSKKTKKIHGRKLG